ncbi:NTPase/helicase [Singapore grouper iridovirus]|uniref:NTPase/helicase n=1 Tax=Singapore grouper iridovirus TaxID=262968 RepID=Q5YFB9_9VIRU|nr:NTPase/helicase [Singapore grouper iridovirus]AAS18161.1 NTPase/helicase [Singapore grouper iridovirus]WAU86855.1 NTPase/helicase [Singapore grouper iridovirus]
MECLYCFEETPNRMKCTVACGATICAECAEASMTAKDDFPTCHCGVKYTPEDVYDDLSEGGKQQLEKFVKTVWDEQMKTLVVRDALIQETKNKWLEQLPPASRMAALKWLPKELDKMAKEKTVISEEKLEECPAEFCMGFRLPGRPCATCKASICEKCDALILSGMQHVCKEEDLQSKAEIDKFVKCPTCFKGVEKIDGCNDMTCAYCKTNFNYRTGEKQTGGTHNKIFIDHHHNRLSLKMKHKLGQDTLGMLEKFEALLPAPKLPLKAPKKYNKTTALQWVSQYVKSESMRIQYGKMAKDLSTLSVEDMEVQIVDIADKFGFV